MTSALDEGEWSASRPGMMMMMMMMMIIIIIIIIATPKKGTNTGSEFPISYIQLMN
jgi:hypothetical protein